MNNKEQVNVLVICSTLNQITNYLMIKKYQPETIVNITLKEDDDTGINIKNKEWDDYLKETIKDNKEKLKYEYEKIDIELEFQELISIADIEESFRVENDFFEILNDKDKIVYWNITGGQRTIALAIQKFILENKREKDRMLYIEGNSEKLLIQDINGLCGIEDYKDEKLNLETAFKLVGFENFDVDEENLIKEHNQKECDIFLKLYDLIVDNDLIFEVNGNDLNLRDHLIESNKGELKSEGRKEYLVEIFNELARMEHLKEEQVEYLTEYKIEKVKKDGEEVEKKKYEIINGSYPAGTIFEMIVGYKLLKVIKNGDYNIVDMRMNCRVKFDGATKDDDSSDKQVDELDIILLTATGQIIIFECKSGGMSSDNAKSHKYTTYRLAGVFGAPIFLTPLFEEERKESGNIEEKRLSTCLSAYRSANRAELETWAVDNIEDGFETLMKKYKEEGAN
ncbi:hypothetical protein U472_10875 [Orenia metallireducens]|uniref:DUF1887 family protein n=1 Tax=Orenia metallireducens TaxID=1413210 RepID=A0A1C0A8D7_9FIRM|nr:hypothetical protein [Orenia metallireducens]OCL26492.1 hypothetical protein U472_10875 [Orenia metallireducens]